MTTTRLCQIVAIEKGVKAKTTRDFTDAHHTVMKVPLLNGISRTYQPRDDDGDRLPPESTQVIVKAEIILDNVATILTRLFDVTATKDCANTEAKSNVVVGGAILLHDVPVTNLLFLEKQLVDLRTFVAKLPTLDPAETWHHDAAAGVWAAEPTQTTKGKKVPRNHVKAEATVQHPAQVELWHEDIIVGDWTTKKFSGALPVERVQTLVSRVDALIEAVKFAREDANLIEVVDTHYGQKIFDYMLAL
jgi:hypothetical protein